MNIGVIIPEIGGYTPLSLEFRKWHQIMKDLDHEVHIITGKSGIFLNNVTVLSELNQENEQNLALCSKLYDITDQDTEELEEIERASAKVQSIIQTWFKQNNIELLLIENYFSIPLNLTVTYGLYKCIQEIDCKIIIKHHDAFYRNNIEQVTQSLFIKKIMLTCFPVQKEGVYHICTNRYIRKYLSEQCGLSAVIIPYVVNFKEALPEVQEKRLDINELFMIEQGDKVLINFSEIYPSSNIKEIIKLMKRINDQKFKIVSIVKEHMDFGDYYDYLNNLIKEEGLASRLILIKESVISEKSNHQINELFSMSKGIITLNSGVGYGQPIHMAIKHKCPLLFCTEAKLGWIEMTDLGCKHIPISETLTDEDIQKINHYINTDLTWGEENHALIKQHYSMSLLQYLIKGLLLKV